MNLTKAMIERAINLSTRELERALADNSYEGDKVTTAEFKHINSITGSFVYHITYPDTDTGTQKKSGLYVKYNNLGQLVADY